MSKNRILLLALFAAALGTTACSKSEDSASAGAPPRAKTSTTTTTVVTPATDPAAKAAEIFAQRCVPCHGAEGRGDGVASASLTPRPRNFHDAEWQKQVTDEHLTTIIKVGGGAVGLSPAMPSNPDLNDAAVLSALKDYIRTLGKTP
jgi:mono/diheme cytochrome c family protein